MKRANIALSSSFLLLLACPSDSGEAPTGESGAMQATTGGEAVPDDSASGVVPTSGSTGDSLGTTGEAFILEMDGGAAITECDVWTDDCPEGQKCMPWASDGGSSWNATRCSPLDANAGQVGDECTVEGSGVSGLDTCGPRSMCYYTDSETNIGICVSFCEGTQNAPSCQPDFICTIVNDGVLTLCRPTCDPILQDCAGDASCLQATGSDGFTCIADASGEGGQPGDPCEFINACDPGSYCASAELVPACSGASGCCTEFCDITDAAAAAGCSLGAGQECVPWFDKGAEPPGLEHVGICALPV